MSDKKANLNPMDEVDFEKQEEQLLSRAKVFREKHSKPGNSLGVSNEVVDIFSDGVRMSATIWRPDNSAGKLLPAILLCHGWGGKRAHLDFSYAPKFAAAGFIALTFDYRTWGDSDPVIVPVKKLGRVSADDARKSEGINVNVRAIRKVIDPEWQLRDIDSAIWYLLGLEGVDKTRIGIWGSSLGGGHVLATAAKNNKIACVVAQIGSIDTHANWVNRHPTYRGVQAIESLATEQARGNIFPWTIVNPRGLDGSPNLPKIVFEHKRNTLNGVEDINVPTLLLAAEQEELFRNEKNTVLVYEKMKSKGKAHVELGWLPGGHYDAYSNPAYQLGLQKATDWFQLYLGTPAAKL